MITQATANRYSTFGPLGSPAIKCTSTYVACEDLELIKKVFPEPGTQTRLPGMLVARFADYLREEGLTEPEKRRADINHFNILSAVDSFLSKPHNAITPCKQSK